MEVTLSLLETNLLFLELNVRLMLFSFTAGLSPSHIPTQCIQHHPYEIHQTHLLIDFSVFGHQQKPL